MNSVVMICAHHKCPSVCEERQDFPPILRCSDNTCVSPGEEFVGADDADTRAAAFEFGPVEGGFRVGVFEVLPAHADFEYEQAALAQVVARFV